MPKNPGGLWWEWKRRHPQQAKNKWFIVLLILVLGLKRHGGSFTDCRNSDVVMLKWCQLCRPSLHFLLRWICWIFSRTTCPLTVSACKISRLVVDGRDAAVAALRSNQSTSTSRQNGRTSWLRQVSWLNRMRISTQVQVQGLFSCLSRIF